jgi:4-nitrophenyl phosphatase
VLERLRRVGVDAEPEDLVTSAQAATTLLQPGQRVLPVAQGGALEALEAAGMVLVEAAPADAVVVGYTNHFDYERLTAACRALRGGARLVGTNDDATYPTPDGLVPGAGSLLAAVATAGGVTPDVAGKPNGPMATLVRQRAADVAVMVGDRPSTDGRFAERLGVAFALVLSGVTRPDEPVADPAPAVTAADLATLVRTTFDGHP